MNIWELVGEQLKHVSSIDAAKTSIVSVSLAIRENDVVVIASWVS